MLQKNSLLLDREGQVVGVQAGGRVVSGEQLGLIAAQMARRGEVSRPYLGLSLKQQGGRLLVINISSSSPACTITNYVPR